MVCICCALAVNLVYCTTPTGQPYVLWPSNLMYSGLATIIIIPSRMLCVYIHQLFNSCMCIVGSKRKIFVSYEILTTQDYPKS